MRHVSFSLLFLIGYQASTLAQESYSALIGEVTSNQPVEFTGLQLELQSLSDPRVPALSAHIAAEGRFEVRQVPNGQYKLAVTDYQGNQIHCDYVVMPLPSRTLTINLRFPEKQRPAHGSVSLQQLKHKPVKAALKAFNKSVKLRDRGDLESSLKLLKKAVDLDPEYVPAINDLASRYLMSGRLDDAVALYGRALEIDPYLALVQGNLAHALLIKRNYAGAEAAARRAVELDPEAPKPQFFLGLSMVMQHKYTPDAVAYLRRTQHFSPRASLALGVALANTGAIEDARRTLATCLRSQEAPIRAEAERLLSKLGSTE
jgi:tetratricopeptide (TPR) repeat protein